MKKTDGYERYSPGDLLPDVSDGFVRRYAMVGNTYLTQAEIGARADDLWARAFAIGKTAWFAEIVTRLRLCNPDTTPPSDLDALIILAKAGVTWDLICDMKS